MQNTHIADNQQTTVKIPMWIKIFGWLHSVMGTLALIGFFVSFVVSIENAKFMFLGLESVGSPHDPMAILIGALMVVFGFAAYGLLFQKSWGLKACLITGWLALFICIGNMVYFLSKGTLMLRLELIAIVPFLMFLNRARRLG